MCRSTPTARNRRSLPPLYVFGVVCLATVLLGTLVWRPPGGAVHVRAKINQMLPSSLVSDSPPVESADTLLDAFVQVTNQRLLGQPLVSHPQVVCGTVTSADRVDTDGLANSILLTATAVNSPLESTIELNYVSHSASEAMIVADDLSRQYVDFVTERVSTATAGNVSTDMDDLVARFQEIAESAERHLHEFVASFLDRPADREVSEQQDQPLVATSNAPLASVIAPTVLPVANDSDHHGHGTVQVGSHRAEASPSSTVEADDRATAIWYATREQLKRDENRLSQMLVDLQESHPRVQQLRFELAHLRSNFEKMRPPLTALPQGNSVLSAATPQTAGVVQEAHSSVRVELVTTMPQLNQRTAPPNVDVAGPQQKDREKYELLKDEMEQARQQYEQARRDERQAQREYLATQLPDILLFRLESARVVREVRSAGIFRLVCLGLLGLGSGAVISLLFCRQRVEFVGDVEQARQLIPSPILAQIPHV